MGCWRSDVRSVVIWITSKLLFSYYFNAKWTSYIFALCEVFASTSV